MGDDMLTMKKMVYLLILLLTSCMITSCIYENKDETDIQETYEHSKKNNESSIENIEEMSNSIEEENGTKNVVEKFLTLYQALDSSAGEYLADRPEGTEIQFNGIQALLAKRMTFSVENSKMEGNEYLVSTQIKTVDFKVAFETVTNVVNEDTSEDIILEKLYDIVNSESSQTRNFSVIIPVQKYGEEYKIKLTPELSNALFGGYNEYLSEMIGGMFDE